MIRKLNLLLVLVLVLSLLLTACGGGDEPAAVEPPAEQATEPAQPAGDPEKGKAQFTPCIGCHGANGEGVEGLGKAMAGSAFIQSSTDDDMLVFLKKGRPIGDPENTTGVDMPPKGGNPALSDEDLLDIIAFMRTLQ